MLEAVCKEELAACLAAGEFEPLAGPVQLPQQAEDRHQQDQDEAQQRYEKMYASASTPQDIYALISMEVRNQNYDKAFKLVDRYMENLEKSDGNSEWLRFFPNISRMLPQLQYALSSEHREEDLIHLLVI